MDFEKESLLGDYDTVLNDLESSLSDLKSAVRSIEIYEVGSQHLSAVKEIRDKLEFVITDVQREYEDNL